MRDRDTSTETTRANPSGAGNREEDVNQPSGQLSPEEIAEGRGIQ